MEDEEFGTLQELERSATIDYIRAIEAERDAAIERAEVAEARIKELEARLAAVPEFAEYHIEDSKIGPFTESFNDWYDRKKLPARV